MEQNPEKGSSDALESRNFLSTAISRILLGLIATYRYLLSPLVGQHCRFYPTCSIYGREAIIRHGPARGSWLTLRRLLRCHPFTEGGLDPVPDVIDHGNSAHSKTDTTKQ